MPRRAINDWIPYLDEVIALWNELGADFKVGDLTLDGAKELRTHLQGTLEKLNALQAEMGLLMGDRDEEISDVESFAVQFRAAVVANFGPNSTQATRVPRVEVTRGRGRSAANAATPQSQ